MKKLLTIFLVAGVLFSLSAGVSWFLQSHQQKAPAGDDAAAADPDDSKPGKGNKPFEFPKDMPPANASLRPALRGAQNPDAETIVQMASGLRNQMDAVRKREQQLTTRQKQLDMIFQDIRKERESLHDLQKQITEEMKALSDKMNSLDQKNVEVNQQRDKVASQVKEIKKNITEFEGSEQNRIKQMATIYDSMEADKAAGIFIQMVDTGKLESAVKILSAMRERQAARILAQIEDPAITVQIMEKLKGLKRPPTVNQ